MADLRTVMRACSLFVLLFSGLAVVRAQEGAADTTQYWKKERQWKVRGFGHTIGVDAMWTKPYDLSTLRLFARDPNVVPASKDFTRVYVLSVALALHAQQDVCISKVDNGSLTGHQWKISLDRFISRLSGAIAEADSAAGDTLYTVSTFYGYAQNEIALGLERRWRSDENRPFYYGVGLGMDLGTTTLSQLFVQSWSRIRNINGTREETGAGEYYPGSRCSYLRAHLTGRVGVRMWKRLDVAVEVAYGAGFQAVHGGEVRTIGSRVAAVLATRWTFKQ